MKSKQFRLWVKNTETGEEWSELLTWDTLRYWWSTGRRSDADAEKLGRKIVDNFNATLRPGEAPRLFIRAEEVEDGIATSAS